MAERHLTGSRIRERRIDLGLKQGDLAGAVGISPSYLNLIEHNRRPIAGRLLILVARVLQVDPAGLSEGTDTLILDQLKAAAGRDADAFAEVAKLEDFAGRFPGWAGLVTRQSRRIEDLESRIKALHDRLSHDPQLATSLHQVITSATSIRSAASILVGDEPIDRDWENRFHRNIYEDSQRLADASRALVAYLDTPPEDAQSTLSPLEEVESYLEAQGFHLPYLEQSGTANRAPQLRSKGANALMAQVRERYREDARAMPLTAFSASAIELDHDPALLADRFGVPLAAAMRRLAALPDGRGHPAMGLAVCDGAGAITFLKPVTGFSLPRTGAGCPLWPLFRAMTQPMQPIRREVSLPAENTRFRCYAIAAIRGAASFDAPPLIESTMLVRPVSASGVPADPVGPACRICSRSQCRARREPSILGDAV